MQKRLSLWGRFKAPTPRFFKIVRTLGIVLGAVGAAVIAAQNQTELPAWLLEAAGYLVTAGAVAGVLAQATVDNAQHGE